MPALATTALTLADLATRLGPDGSLDRQIVELLATKNPILLDMKWVEGNTTTGNRTTVRTGLPQGTWRTLNYGVQPTKSTTAQITDTCGMLEALSRVDKKLVDISNDPKGFRLDEDSAHMEGLAQQMATAVFYSSTSTNPEQIHGLSPRFNTLSASVPSSANIFDAGGVGSDNSSIWRIQWDSKTVAGIYPKGSKAGLQMRDLGEEAAYDDNTPPGEYRVLKTQFTWDAGFMVRDWRYASRICNIDVTNAAGGLRGSTPPDLIKLMIQADDTAPDDLGQTVWYCNRRIYTWLRIQATYKTNVHLSFEEFAGKRVMTFMGNPIRKCDALVLNEARIT